MTRLPEAGQKEIVDKKKERKERLGETLQSRSVPRRADYPFTMSQGLEAKRHSNGSYGAFPAPS